MLFRSITWALLQWNAHLDIMYHDTICKMRRKQRRYMLQLTAVNCFSSARVQLCPKSLCWCHVTSSEGFSFQNFRIQTFIDEFALYKDSEPFNFDIFYIYMPMPIHEMFRISNQGCQMRDLASTFCSRSPCLPRDAPSLMIPTDYGANIESWEGQHRHKETQGRPTWTHRRPT